MEKVGVPVGKAAGGGDREDLYFVCDIGTTAGV